MDALPGQRVKQNFGENMGKVGRPKNDGLQSMLTLLAVIYHYNEARRAGLKHSSALTETVARLREQFPNIPGEPPVRISVSGVKAILVLHQSQDEDTTFTVTEVEIKEVDWAPFETALAEAEKAGYPEKMIKPLKDMIEIVAKNKTALCFGYGPRPRYRRHNAR